MRLKVTVIGLQVVTVLQAQDSDFQHLVLRVALWDMGGKYENLNLVIFSLKMKDLCFNNIYIYSF